jgi:hypothetical protein
MRQTKSSDRFETLYCTPKSGPPTLEPHRIKVKVGWIDLKRRRRAWCNWQRDCQRDECVFPLSKQATHLTFSCTEEQQRPIIRS